MAGLCEQVVAREPLAEAGASGNAVERVTLRDGRQLIQKRVSPEWDWISRATKDEGRALTMWSAGIFDRIPRSVDHATVAVEPDPPGWSIFMRDVSSTLVPRDRRLDRAAVRRILSAVADVHLAFWEQDLPELCGLEDRYHLLSPQTATRETEQGHPVGDTIARCWQTFAELAPDEIAQPILRLANQPRLLAEQLERCEQTLIHGDLRLNNVGLAGDRVVLIDWGERTGRAPAPVELASFLVFDARRFDVAREDVIADFRDLYGDRLDERALHLALIGGLVQLGCNLVLGLVLKGTDEERAFSEREIAWWSGAVATAFEETWAPA